jgi:hypothetical protein
MGHTGFLSTTQVERVLAHARPEAREIALEIRSIVSSVCPQATESLLWGALSYHDPSKGGRVKGAICGVDFRKPQVTLSFIHGVRLADPLNLLRGSRLSKRHLVVHSFDEAPWQAIRDLIGQAASLSPESFDPIVSHRGQLEE